MSAELAVLNKIKRNTDMYCIDNDLFDDTKMLDISGIFPDANLTSRKIVLNLPLKLNLRSDNINPFGDGSLITKARFNDNLIDDLGAYNYGVIGSTSYISGKFNKAWQTLTRNNYISVPNLGDFFDNRTEYSINFWVQPQRDNRGTPFTFCVSNFSHTVPHYQIALVFTTTGGTSYNQSSGGSIAFGGVFDQDTFYNIVITYKNGVQKLYVDGGFQGENTSVYSQMGNCFSTAMFGRLPAINSTLNACAVTVDHFEVYNRELTQEEVTRLYNMEA